MSNDKLLFCGIGFIVTFIAFLATLPPPREFNFIYPEGWKESYAGSC